MNVFDRLIISLNRATVLLEELANLGNLTIKPEHLVKLMEMS